MSCWFQLLTHLSNRQCLFIKTFFFVDQDDSNNCESSSLFQGNTLITCSIDFYNYRSSIRNLMKSENVLVTYKNGDSQSTVISISNCNNCSDCKKQMQISFPKENCFQLLNKDVSNLELLNRWDKLWLWSSHEFIVF